MIPKIKSFHIIKEIDTNSVPVELVGEDQETYFAKYIQDENDFDYLVYEIVCQVIAKRVKIRVPDIAYVEIDPKQVEFSGQIQKNYRFYESGVIAFGSKKVPRSDIISKSALNKLKLKNPLDSILISLFDIHVHNVDRSEANYNILLQRGQRNSPNLLFAIDHFACFGGPVVRGNFDPTTEINLGDKILTSDFVKEIIKKHEIKMPDVNYLLDKYFTFFDEDLKLLISQTFKTIPSSWDYTENLEELIINYLYSKERQSIIKEKVGDYLVRVIK